MKRDTIILLLLYIVGIWIELKMVYQMMLGVLRYITISFVIILIVLYNLDKSGGRKQKKTIFCVN